LKKSTEFEKSAGQPSLQGKQAPPAAPLPIPVLSHSNGSMDSVEEFEERLPVQEKQTRPVQLLPMLALSHSKSSTEHNKPEGQPRVQLKRAPPAPRSPMPHCRIRRATQGTTKTRKSSRTHNASLGEMGARCRGHCVSPRLNLCTRRSRPRLHRPGRSYRLA
jgi:hypothetical protein